jgi:DNA-binding FadR family transcriptional regulator
MKSETVFKRAFNDALDLLAALEDGDALPSETVLSAQLGVSRTTVRKVLSTLAQQGTVAGSGRRRSVRSDGGEMQRFPAAETVPMADQIEKRFME